MNAVGRITDINTSVAEWKDDITRVMASDVNPDKFIAAVTTALTMNPEIVQKCTSQSIKTACIKAAYDGLRPDGKEGALVAYGSEAQWMPMVFGVRKKAKDHDDIIITAREVREKDHFEVVYGLKEDLIHNPDMSARDRGPIVATYAVFRKGDEVLHFEVMTAEDIDKVRAASKSSNSPAWRNWYGEMGKKAAVNRGSKSVPMSDAVRQVIDRDNDLYDLDNIRDVTPPRVPLGQALAAGKSRHNEGFSLAHVHSETQQMPTDRIDVSTGEIIETNVADHQTPSRQAQSTNSSSRTSSQADDEKSSGGANTSSQRAPAGDFTEFSMALLRFGGTGNGREADIKKITAATDQFWESKGGRPDHPADSALAKAIIGLHLKRMAGELDIDAVKADSAKAVDSSYNGL